jgi:DNA-binding response OmpR family regulator
MYQVLCIEDEPYLREDLAEMLAKSGYEVLLADDGVQGLDMILDHKPDLVISDITMPRMNGHELVSIVRREHPELAAMPFIFLSALTDRKDILDGVRLGADDYLVKPIDFEMLLAKVRACLRQSGRIVENKNVEMIKLYRTLAAGKDGEHERQWPKMPQKRVSLVGESDKGLWEIQRFLERLGHNVNVFTSGAAYRGKVEKPDADLTLLWFHSDDMQAPMLLKMLSEKSGIYVMVVPEDIHDPERQSKPPGFDDIIGLPVSDEELYQKLQAWISWSHEPPVEQTARREAN